MGRINGQRITFAVGVILAMFAACKESPPTAPEMKLPSSQEPHATWVSPQPCQIGVLVPTPPGGTGSPTNGTSPCGISWSMNLPPFTDGFSHPVFWWQDVDATDYHAMWCTGSERGCGVQNGPLTFIFSKPITNFTVRDSIWGPDYSSGVNPGLDPGHHMVAYNQAGQVVDSVDFSVGVQFDEKVLTAKGITRVLLYPVKQGESFGTDIVEPVDYRASFAVDSTCPFSGDSVLNSPEALQNLKDALSHSNPNAVPGSGQKKEVGGIIWRAPDGHYYAQEVFDPNATECTFDPSVLRTAQPTIEGSTQIAQFHTHPSVNTEDTYGCPGFGLSPATSDPDNKAAGGGSDEDWKTACAFGGSFPGYVVTKTGHIYRLDCQQKSQKSKNPNKWDINGYLGCPVRFT